MKNLDGSNGSGYDAWANEVCDAVQFSLGDAIALYESDEEFPVDLDDAWRWIGYGKKQNALDALCSIFEETLDFSRWSVKSPAGGRPKDCVRLSLDCFKQLGMMARTSKGKEIRRYFLECERIAQSKQADPTIPPRITAAQVAAHMFEENEFSKFAKKSPDAVPIFLQWQGVKPLLVQPQPQVQIQPAPLELPDSALLDTLNNAFLNLNRSGLAMNKLFHFVDRIPTMRKLDEQALKDFAELGQLVQDLQRKNDELEVELERSRSTARKSSGDKFGAENIKLRSRIQTLTQENNRLQRQLRDCEIRCSAGVPKAIPEAKPIRFLGAAIDV
ncbi:MAG: hypothetical protein ACRC62_15400 [Microcoleus sp.]